MHRRCLHVLSLLCALAAPFVVVSGAGADAASAHGWWYQLNSGDLPVAPPAPPNAAPGGIYVANTPAAVVAYGAVRIESAATEGTATFAVESASPALEVALCPTTTPWQPADGGVWGQRPEYDCEQAKVLGVLDESGSKLTFQITDQLSDGNGVFDLAIVPDPVISPTMELALAAPGGDFFTVTSTTPAEAPAVGPPADTSSLPDTSGGGFTPSDGTSGSTGSFDTVPPAGAGGEVPVDDGTGTAATDPSAAGGGNTSTVEDVAKAVSPDTATERMVAGGLLLALAAGLWWMGNRSSAVLDPALAKAGAITADGGVGRFARPRSAKPISLT